MSAKTGGLGKGLSAIFLENDSDDEGIKTLNISEIEPNRDQPRKEFDLEALEELAESIAQHGILQPLLVRPTDEDYYQIVAGERRWRAARMVGLKEVPVIIKDLTDAELMEVALIENLQREDLSPIEEAMGYKALMDTHALTHEQVSNAVGKSRSVITNALRLLTLPEEVIELISQGKLSSGHARALLALTYESDILKVAKEVVKKDLSVRDTEKMCKDIVVATEKKQKEKKKKNPFFSEVEISLKGCLGRRVKVLGSGKKKGVLQIEFYNEEDLLSLASLLER